MSTLTMLTQHTESHLPYVDFRCVFRVALYLYKFLPHLKVIQCYKQQKSLFFLSFAVMLIDISSSNRTETKWVQHVDRMVGVEKLVGQLRTEDKLRVPENNERLFLISVKSMASS